MPKKPRLVTEQIPASLQTYIATQDFSLYTPIDHASWRFILRIARAFFSKHAHEKYLAGLKETGISTERIPRIEEMDACLRRFGWRAVPVSGFIPPAAFMEFQSLGILPIACEMRTLDHLAYTPAPDIVHEAAGHAPIIADPEYAHYLRNYGEIARKAIYTDQDMAVYEAIRQLSVIKEDPLSTLAHIETAQKKLDQAIAAVTWVSESSSLARMNWWTVEYGLVGDIDSPKIYGAGLLSSVGESYHCLNSEVEKIPLTIDCIKTSYDITKPQPQLFVTENFEHLNTVLEEFSETMAYRHGGKEGLQKARRAATVCTAVLENGLQISGKIVEATESQGMTDFLKFAGPVQLSFKDHELPGHSAKTHKDGYSTPLGNVVMPDGALKSPADLSAKDLESLGFSAGEKSELVYRSGIILEGVLIERLEHEGKSLVLKFEDCTVKRGNEFLYRPEWGTFDLACGTKAVSVFGGPADHGAYLKATSGYEQPQTSSKCNLTDENRELNDLYEKIREIRENPKADLSLKTELETVLSVLDSKFKDDWLLRIEMLELVDREKLDASLENRILEDLERISKTRQDRKELITRGLALRGFKNPAEAPIG